MPKNKNNRRINTHERINPHKKNNTHKKNSTHKWRKNKTNLPLYTR